VIAKRLALALVTGAIAMVGLTGTAQAFQVGDTCQVASGGNAPDGGWYVTNWAASYEVYNPQWIIIDGITPPNSLYVHRAGKPSGYTGYATIIQSTCHH
jgi:hypothetical protein